MGFHRDVRKMLIEKKNPVASVCLGSAQFHRDEALAAVGIRQLTWTLVYEKRPFLVSWSIHGIWYFLKHSMGLKHILNYHLWSSINYIDPPDSQLMYSSTVLVSASVALHSPRGHGNMKKSQKYPHCWLNHCWWLNIILMMTPLKSHYCLVVWNLAFIFPSYWESYSQLTKSIIFQRGGEKPPTSH